MRIPKKTIMILAFVILLPSAVTSTEEDKVVITHIKSENIYINVSTVCIEGNGTRIYIDLFDIPQEYTDKPADVIFITHDHLAHYDPTSINLVAQNTTTFIGPSSCSEFISEYDGIGVVPGDNGTVAGIHYEAFRAYNFGHPYGDNLCGYIITVNGIRIYHSGDTGNIPEFQNLTGKIDVLILAVGDSYATMDFEDAVDAIGVIQPKYLIPIHYLTQSIKGFITECTETYPDLEIYTDELILPKETVTGTMTPTQSSKIPQTTTIPKTTTSHQTTTQTIAMATGYSILVLLVSFTGLVILWRKKSPN
jgi:L-ascorbate metabolism protein UlaG (beta-lactamase superfamily)